MKQNYTILILTYTEQEKPSVQSETKNDSILSIVSCKPVKIARIIISSAKLPQSDLSLIHI